eukprot:3804074-Amphidinium_carterae.1
MAGERAIDSLVRAQGATSALMTSSLSSQESLSSQDKPKNELALISKCDQLLQAALADGCIRMDEAAALAAAQQAASGAAGASQTRSTWGLVFNDVDADGDGCISKVESAAAVDILQPFGKKPALMLLAERASAT